MENQTNQAFNGEQGPGFDLKEVVVFALGRFRYQIVVVACLGLAFGLFQALTIPNFYGSTGKFLVRLGKREAMTPETVMGVGDGQRSGIAIKEEIQILRSRDLFERVARDVGPERLLEPYDPARFDNDKTPIWTRWQHAVQAWWFDRQHPGSSARFDPGSEQGRARAAELVEDIDFYSDRSSVVYVTFFATSPELARDVVDAAMRASQQRHREVFEKQYNKDFVGAQLDESQSQYELATQEYHEHRRDCGFFDLDTQREGLLTRRSEVSGALTDAEVRMKTVEKLITHHQGRLEVIPAVVRVKVEAEIVPNPVHVGLQDKIKEERTKLAQLPAQFKKGTPLYEASENQILVTLDTLQNQLAETEPLLQIADEREEDIANPEIEELYTRIAELEAEKVGLLTQLENLTEQGATLDKELARLLACEPTHQSMQQRVDQASLRSTRLRETQSEAESIAALNQIAESSNLVIIEEATYDPDKAGPQRSKLVIKGLAGGLAFGLLLALLRQLLDTKVRFPGSLERSMGVRVLGVIPEQSSWRRMGKRLQRSMRLVG